MSDNDTPSSPRKKVKLDHPSPDTHHASVASNQDKMEVNHGPATSPKDDRLGKDVACGITEYVSPDALAFSGILKKRYTDFLVNEILPSGEVLHLSNLKAPDKRPAKREEFATPASTKDTPHNGPDALPDKDIEHSSGDMQNNAKSDIDDNLNKSSPIAATKADSTVERPLISDNVFKAPSQNGAVGNAPSMFDSDDPLARHFAPRPPTPPHLRKGTVDASKLTQQNAENEKREEVGRTRHRTFLRLTSEGWQELTPEQDAEFKANEEREAAQRAANSSSLTHEGEAKAFAEAEAKKEKARAELFRPSTVSSWNNYAGAQDIVIGKEATGPSTVNAYEASKPLREQQQVNGLQTSTTSWNAYAGDPDRLELKDQDKNLLLSHFSPEVFDAVRSLYNRIAHNPSRPSRSYGNVRTNKSIDRATRGKLHQDLRRIFNGKLDSETDHYGHIIIKAASQQPSFHGRATTNDKISNHRHEKGKKSKDSTWQGKSKWDELGGDYLHFTLHKENKDTMESLSYLTKRLRTDSRKLQFAGTKDRRGVTVQRVSIYRVALKNAIDAGKTLKNACIGDFEYHPQGLQLGDLKGNEFLITLRNCNFLYPGEADSETIRKGAQTIVGESVQKLSDRGFINYYGLQRFGTFGTRTDIVGLALLQDDYQKAVDCILSFNPACLEPEVEDTPSKDRVSNDDRARAEGINGFLNTGNAEKALDRIPGKSRAERDIINHLSQRGRGSDYLGAIKTINRNLRLMYVHAYQSLVWNHAASERWRLFRDKVVEGDLVIIEKESSVNVGKSDVDAEGEVIIHAAEDDRATNASDEFTRARALTKEEAESGNYSIFDIVLPTPGWDVVYPANATGNFYEVFMASERGGGLNPYDMRRSWKDASLSGAYRKLLTKPLQPITFEIKLYEAEDEQFVETDLDRYYKAHPGEDHRRNRQDLGDKKSTYDPQAQEALVPEKAPVQDSSGEQVTSDQGLESKADAMAGVLPLVPAKEEAPSNSTDTDTSGGVRLDWNGKPKEDKKIAVILKMQLSSSQYATMALRELMKKGGVQWKGDFGAGH